MADRSILLNTVAELLEGELPDIAHGVTTDMGKPFAQAKGEVAKCANTFRWFAEHGEALLADQEVLLGTSVGRIPYRPLGAVLVMASWSFPLWQATRFLVPAVMAGNVGLLKLPPNVPRTALVFEDLFRRAGAPDGLVQALLVGTDQLPAILADRRVAAVAVGALALAGPQATHATLVILFGIYAFVHGILSTAAAIGGRGQQELSFPMKLTAALPCMAKRSTSPPERQFWSR